MAVASARDKCQRHGRHNSSINTADKPTRIAVVPCAPTTGNNHCLAHDVPIPNAVTEPSTAMSGIKR